MFEVGDYVVYGGKGVCCIADIAAVDVPGAGGERLHYVMHPVGDPAGTVYLPTDSRKAIIRRVMTAQEAEQLISDIPYIEQLSVPDERSREKCYKDAMRTCSGRVWVSVIKTLSARQNERVAAGRKITSLDERYLRAAQKELTDELSIALGIPGEEVHDYVHSRIDAASEAVSGDVR